MEREQSMSSMDDLIFEKRNKLYGAYELRANYHNRLVKSFLISVTVLVTVVVFSTINRKVNIQHPPIVYNDTLIVSDPFQVEQKHPAIVSPPESRPAHIDEHAFIAVTDTVVHNELVDTSNHSTEVVMSVTGSGHSSDTVMNASPSVESSVKSMASVDKVPEFPGGMEKFYNYLVRKIRYTERAREVGVNAKMYVRFIVDEGGYISNVSVVKMVGYGLDEQVVDVLTNSPRWQPGTVMNTAVKTEMVLPVAFSIKN